MGRTIKWARWAAAPAAALALGVATPATAQDFQATVAKAQKTLTDLIAVIDGIETRNKAARAAYEAGGGARTTAAAPTGAKTYTLILTGAQ
jgi:hypothetical protein